MSDRALFDAAAMGSTPQPNPCVLLYGHGPAGKQCRTCALLRPGERGHSKMWYKCALRTPRPATDHRVRWDACGRYEAAPCETHTYKRDVCTRCGINRKQVEYMQTPEYRKEVRPRS